MADGLTMSTPADQTLVAISTGASLTEQPSVGRAAVTGLPVPQQ